MQKIYTDYKYITQEHRKNIFPLLLDLCYLKESKMLDNFTLVSEIEDCNVAIVPVNIAYFYENKLEKELFKFIKQAQFLHKKVWIYTAGDFGFTINENVTAFRLGGFDSILSANTQILPPFNSDPYILIKEEFRVLSKEVFPTIGFVGHANNSWVKWAKEGLIYLRYNYKRIQKKSYIDYQPFYPSSIKRYKFLSDLVKNKEVKTDFIFRKKYRAGVKNKEQLEQTTLEFFQNIEHNLYTFCLRGAGNFSVRFYETLAMGRIPLLINTDVRLPLSDIICWEDHCVIATKDDFIQKLLAFHKSKTEAELMKIQINNRSLWIELLSREGYFKQISNFL